MINRIEALMVRHFSTIPFHNLSLLYGEPNKNKIPGGTCSDKTLAFLADARSLGTNAYLHTAFIGGKEIHRLVRVHLSGRIFYADVGNGWPALRLLPDDEEISFSCFGMKYRTEVANNWLRVYHERQGKECLQIEINKTPRPNNEILDQINSRYNSGIKYPFSNSLRFSLIVGNEFLFLRGNRLERYSTSGYSEQMLEPQAIPTTIHHTFGFKVLSYFETAQLS